MHVMMKEAEEKDSDTSGIKMRSLTVDDVLSITGQFGRSQRIYYACLSFLQVFIAFHMLLSVFTGR